MDEARRHLRVPSFSEVTQMIKHMIADVGARGFRNLGLDAFAIHERPYFAQG